MKTRCWIEYSDPLATSSPSMNASNLLSTVMPISHTEAEHDVHGIMAHCTASIGCIWRHTLSSCPQTCTLFELSSISHWLQVSKSSWGYTNVQTKTYTLTCNLCVVMVNITTYECLDTDIVHRAASQPETCSIWAKNVIVPCWATSIDVITKNLYSYTQNA